MKTKKTLRTNLDALRPSFEQAGQPPSRKAPQPDEKPRTGPSAMRANKAPRTGRAPRKGTTAARTRPTARRDQGDEEAPGDGDLPSRGEFVAAYTRVLPEIDALPREEARRINVYVPGAVKVALGARPRLLRLREAMRAKLIDPPDEALDKLRDYALAAAHAYARVMLHDQGETRVRTLLSEATPLRERLLSSASNLVTFGLLDAQDVAVIRQGTGHVDTANDLLALGTLFHEAGPEVVAKTPLTQADVERAGELGELLLEALGQREQGTDGSTDPREAEEQLAKAYELLFRAYDECRRAVLYLRWHEGDGDQIAPSLLQSRRRSRRTQADEPDGDEPTPGAPGGGVPGVGAPGGEADAG